MYTVYVLLRKSQVDYHRLHHFPISSLSIPDGRYAMVTPVRFSSQLLYQPNYAHHSEVGESEPTNLSTQAHAVLTRVRAHSGQELTREPLIYIPTNRPTA